MGSSRPSQPSLRPIAPPNVLFPTSHVSLYAPAHHVLLYRLACQYNLLFILFCLPPLSDVARQAYLTRPGPGQYTCTARNPLYNEHPGGDPLPFFLDTNPLVS
ncbi:hypothetical protein P691DRAFT_811870 [Macrolepiota fuliginosa MF-IS2]|uniref:Uncharacterized protein n=1 Tax=Macrolepiota fuliginosa MF-IS2 TaxID=1400762 RepID=A0A9P5XIG1_9AGAR|nr:hypothetical protein P691DRAFT_811870 [Macrolepiota fuliginosa MF-IS2]